MSTLKSIIHKVLMYALGIVLILTSCSSNDNATEVNLMGIAKIKINSTYSNNGTKSIECNATLVPQ
jgi:hypothetical protein